MHPPDSDTLGFFPDGLASPKTTSPMLNWNPQPFQDWRENESVFCPRYLTLNAAKKSNARNLSGYSY